MDQNNFWNLLAKHLSGEALPEEKAELEELIKFYPDLSFAAQNVSNIWSLQGDTNSKEAEEAFKKHSRLLADVNFPVSTTISNNNSLPTRFRRKRALLAFAGILVLVMFSGGWFILSSRTKTPVRPAAQDAEVSTRPGSRTKLILPDSSVVWLNSGSKLTYTRDFGISNRKTTLVGEAFFDVKKNSIPFVIQTNTIQIKVMGTAFNVKSFPNEQTTETSLIRGQVEVTLDKRPGEIFILKPNEKLVVANHPGATNLETRKKHPIVILKEITQVNDTTIMETSWVENQLMFHNESFEDVARKMERWYNVQIDIKDDVLSQMLVGGGPFENESIGEALVALQIAFNFKFTIKGNYITITN